MIGSSSTSSSAQKHKVFSPQPVKFSGYAECWSPNSFSPETNNNNGSSAPGINSLSPVRRLLFASPNEQSQPQQQLSPLSQPALFLEEINRLRADSMNQLENEINRSTSSTETAPFSLDNNLLLEQLELDFANFPY